MSGFLCSMVGASFVTVVAEVLRSKKGITAVGNAQVDTAQSKFGGASALFDGTGDYLLVNGFSSDFGTGDFTIETWVRFNTIGVQVIYDRRTIGASSTGLLIYYSSGFIYHGNGATRISGGTASTGVWYHLSVSRSSGSTKMFLDGTQIGSTYTDTLNYAVTNQATYIGESVDFATASAPINGYLDEFRISDTARYTTTFTPSTTAFVNDANTKLLLHMNGTDATTFFEDDNGVGRSPKGIIAFGNAQIDTAQSKFGGSSAQFDGTGDYLRVSASSDLAFSTGNWTIESWFRTNNVNTSQSLWDFRNNGGDNNAPYVYLLNQNVHYGEDGANRITSGAYILSTSTWYHISVVRSGNTVTLYIDGSSRGTYTTAKNHTTSYTPTIGDNSFGSAYWNGWIDEFRISDTARYTTTFTPSTTPFVNDANTKLLLHMDGGDAITAHTVFRDDNGVGRAAKSVIYRGNEQIDNAQSKFGGTSVYLDGDWDSPRVYMNGSWPSNLTIEGWFRPTDVTDRLLWSTRTANNTLAAGEMQAYITAASKLQINLGSSVMTSTTTFATNTWYHVAVTKDGSSWKLWVNGTNEVSFTTATSVSGYDLVIGNTIEAFQFIPFQGWIDEFRVSDTARYSATFTPATAQFQNDSNTILLLHFDGTDASNIFIDDNGVTPTHSYT